MKPLIILAGPTGVGKTELSIRLASEIGGEIVSADSVQIYRGMDIGSAKITKEEMAGIPHYLIDILNPDDPFDITRFQMMARECISDIHSRGKIPMLVGGTGFYIQSVYRDVNFTDESTNEKLREKLQQIAEEKGCDFLFELLMEKDAESAAIIPKENIRRVIRALEYYETTGVKISEHNAKEQLRQPIYDTFFYVLTDDRKILYERINKRVDIMLRNGLIEEVKQLLEDGISPEAPSMQAIGYRQTVAYLNGELNSIEELREQIAIDTRHFAKRQLTWFRREADVKMLDRSLFQNNNEQILNHILDDLNNNHIIQRT